jgi:hypothetical protein
MAAAIGVIGGAAVWIGGWLDGSSAAERLIAADGDVIESGTAEGDSFVRFLLEHAGADPVELNVDVRAPEGWQETAPNMVLWYQCDPGEIVGDGACLRVRLELPGDSPVLTKPLGWRFRGTYRIAVRTGAGFGTDMDIVFDDITR